MASEDVTHVIEEVRAWIDAAQRVVALTGAGIRSEERRVGKECRL